MKSHSWIVGILEDLIGYAERNKLNRTLSALIDATETVAPEVNASPRSEGILHCEEATSLADNEKGVIVVFCSKQVPQ